MHVRSLRLLFLLILGLTSFCFIISKYYSEKKLLHRISAISTSIYERTFLSVSSNGSLPQILAQRRQQLEAKSFCAKLLQNNKSELERIKADQKVLKWEVLENLDRKKTNHLRHLAEANCSDFLIQRGYFTVPTSSEESEFPIAFSILMYKHVSQAERLLRAIYSPHNYYCFHVDSKAVQLIHDAMQAIVSCFPNVFIVPNPTHVKWGEISILDAERKCIRQLIRRSKKWYYFINLTGEEFPLWSNRQLVRILRAYNGSNDIEYTKDLRPGRFRYVWRNGKKTRILKRSPPKQLKMARGEIHIVATRGFVELAVNDNNRLASEFFRWTRDVLIPDEFYYATLNFNAQALKTPGGLPSNFTQAIDSKQWYNARFKLWLLEKELCAGKWQREVCVLGVGDIGRLAKAPKLFVNKFDITFDPFAYECVEYLQLNRTVASASSDFSFDTTFYSNLPFVKARRYCCD